MNSIYRIRLAAILIAMAAISQPSSAATFIEPTTWSLNDFNSTTQTWTAGGTISQPITSAGQLVHNSNPVLETDPALSQTGGFVGGSGGFYSFSGTYTVSASIPGHTPTGAAGTYVMVQFASTLNPDYDPEGNQTGGSVIRDTIKVFDSSDTLVATSAVEEVERTFYAPNYPLFGGVGYEEIVWQVFVPDLVGDFRVSADVWVHAGVQAVRVDSLVALSTAAIPGDFNGDGAVDGADFVIWQTNFPINSGEADIAMGDANDDGNVDGADFVIWQTNFPTLASSTTAVPEPASVVCLLGIALSGVLFSRRKIAAALRRMDVSKGARS